VDEGAGKSVTGCVGCGIGHDIAELGVSADTNRNAMVVVREPDGEGARWAAGVVGEPGRDARRHAADADRGAAAQWPVDVLAPIDGEDVLPDPHAAERVDDDAAALRRVPAAQREERRERIGRAPGRKARAPGRAGGAGTPVRVDQTWRSANGSPATRSTWTTVGLPVPADEDSVRVGNPDSTSIQDATVSRCCVTMAARPELSASA